MERSILIDSRLYDSIVELCQERGEDPDRYIFLTLQRAVSLDKYGDLNDKIQVKAPVSKQEPAPVPTSDELIPVIAMSPPNPEVSFVVELEKTTKVGNSPESQEEETKPEKKHRTIKTK